MTYVGTLCVYCQQDFASFKELKDHIAEKHPNTYASAPVRTSFDR